MRIIAKIFIVFVMLVDTMERMLLAVAEEVTVAHKMGLTVAEEMHNGYYD